MCASRKERGDPLRRYPILPKRIAVLLNDQGYYLSLGGCYEEALSLLEQSIILKEQGYIQPDSLAAAYSDKSQILVGLGRFEEALLFDEKAFVEIQRLAGTGDSSLQEDIWTYQANRGRLYLRLGRIDDAEQLLRQALPHIPARRRIFQMFAKEALEEIEQWRRTTTSPQHQLDWRWVERYRPLFPVPTPEEMHDALARVRYMLLQGRGHPEMAEVSQRLEEFVQTYLSLPFDHTSSESEIQARPQEEILPTSSLPHRSVFAQVVRRFFEAALHECGYDNWRMVIDPNASGGTYRARTASVLPP